MDILISTNIMARIKLFVGFLFSLVGSGLAILLLAMSLDNSTVYHGSTILELGVFSLFSIFLGVFILNKTDV